METFVSGMIGNLGNNRGCRGGYGFLRKPILCSALRARAVGRTCAENDFRQAVALLQRHVPVFPALRVPVSPCEEQSVFPAPRGEGRGESAAFSSGRFIFPLYLKSSENHISISPDPYPARRFCLHLYKKFYTIKMKKEAHHGQL